MSAAYVAPQLVELGSLEDLTAQTLNKVGTTSDLLTSLTNGIVIGSFVSSP
jgi:hypothetical protein